MYEAQRNSTMERAGSWPLSQFLCTACGYGASCRIAPDRCPMCGGHTWEHKTPGKAAGIPADRDRPLSRERQ